ncbi:MAG TPA: DUF6491 family protein [Steroidobacteraceae bacterium]|nr:DUF6491 family protein [Steroidobacteraceae bacterium]
MTKAKTIWLLLAGGAMSTASFSSHADDPKPPPAAEVQIPFANHNIWNWQVVDDKTVLIQDNSRRWYKATLFGNCINLSFAGERLGFDSSPGGTFDKFSAILVRGQRCPLSSLVQTTAPPKKSKAKKPEAPAAPQ